MRAKRQQPGLLVVQPCKTRVNPNSARSNANLDKAIGLASGIIDFHLGLSCFLYHPFDHRAQAQTLNDQREQDDGICRGQKR